MGLCARCRGAPEAVSGPCCPPLVGGCRLLAVSSLLTPGPLFGSLLWVWALGRSAPTQPLGAHLLCPIPGHPNSQAQHWEEGSSVWAWGPLEGGWPTVSAVWQERAGATLASVCLQPIIFTAGSRGGPCGDGPDTAWVRGWGARAWFPLPLWSGFGGGMGTYSILPLCSHTFSQSLDGSAWGASRRRTWWCPWARRPGRVRTCVCRPC